MTTNSDWIKMSERKPTTADLPVWYFGRPGHATGFYRQLSNHEGWTHWKHAVDSVPEGPKEPTQGEMDHQAYLSLVVECNGPLGGMTAWHAAIRYERAEVLKLLQRIRANTAHGERAYAELIARCTGGQS